MLYITRHKQFIIAAIKSKYDGDIWYIRYIWYIWYITA